MNGSGLNEGGGDFNLSSSPDGATVYDYDDYGQRIITFNDSKCGTMDGVSESLQFVFTLNIFPFRNQSQGKNVMPESV